MMQSLKIGIDQFWEKLRESQLLPESEFDRLRADSASLSHEDSDFVAKWLVGEKAITPLQAKVLRAGHSGQFHFGRYCVIGPGPHENVWLARDQKTAFPVWLHFFPGQSKEDLSAWDKIESRAEQLASVSQPNLIRVYESIVTRDYRFVATAAGGAQSLADKMPLKRRLNEAQAVDVMREVAAAVAELEHNSIRHDSLSLAHIFPNAKQKITRVLPPVTEPESYNGTNTNALARVFYRLLTGRDAPDKKKLSKIGSKKFVESLQTKKIRPRVSELLHEALTSGDSFEPEVFLQRLEKLADSKTDSPKEMTHARETAYLAGLVPWQDEPPVIEDQIPELESESLSAGNPDRQSAPQTKKRQLPVAVPVCLALLGFATLIGVGALIANRKKLDPPKLVVERDKSTDADLLDAATVAENRRKEIETLMATQAYVQEIVEDDSQSLWESPTTGFSIDVAHVPPSPRMIAAVNWASINESEFGSRTLKSLGPKMDRVLSQMEALGGFGVSEIESSITSLHSNLSFEYDPFIVINLKEPVDLEACMQSWGQPTPTPGIERAFEKSGRSWWIVPEDSSEAEPQDSKVTSFVVGPTELVQQVANGEVAALSGTMLRLVESSDANRDVNLILPTISLFNTEGQKLFADQQKWMKELRLLLPESVRGISVSLHHDRGDYLEVRIDNTKDLLPTEAASRMRDRVEERLDQSRIGLQESRALPYWEPVRLRYGAMLRELSGQLRWDSEFGEVIGNAWLPPGAMHNLFAATELAMAFEPTAQTVASSNKPQTPQTLEELLAAPRNLSIANPPDLNVLLKNIRGEVADQYLDLPFEFEIRIAGTDLQKDGITQNQRPGPLQIENRSLSEILTQVMVSANPNREITGASDPNCKLVWVVTEDDETPEKKYVLVTTRTAVTEKGLTLPDAFVAQP
jgi:serine/threonine protein kinase